LRELREATYAVALEETNPRGILAKPDGSGLKALPVIRSKHSTTPEQPRSERPEPRCSV